MNYELAKWRIDKAEKTFQEGCHLLESNYLSGAVNRFILPTLLCTFIPNILF